ncbi:hypothetical protein MTO92_10765 [Lentilactobacillus kefiri]|uniref:hypothetical protein n=1 Tax=Lentilactobacillus kefiri TaxID=33962 RepID=UPI001FB33A34|nr:hypothetical protein [Lentilactobacillus kefiri]UOD78119.1 hypothetical protein MTO92_10765 [Lentilactobacillus kefiri]
MDKSTHQNEPSQARYNHEDHWLGLAVGLACGLALDAVFSFRTGTFFTFIGIVVGMSGSLDFRKKA